MRITPAEVHEQTFRTSFRGFDQIEVDQFLNRLAEELERLIEEKQLLEDELAQERSTKSELEELMGAARQLQTSIVDKAKEDARLIMNQAELVADRLTEEAREKALSIQRDIELLKDRKAALMAELKGLSVSLGDWVERLDAREAEGVEDTIVLGSSDEPTPLIRLAPEEEELEEGDGLVTSALKDDATEAE